VGGPADLHQADRILGRDRSRYGAGRELADTVPGSCPRQLAGLAEAAGEHFRGGKGSRQQQRLRDGGVPDLIGVGSGPAPDQVAAGDLRPGADTVGESGQLQPRGKESRCLSALTGCGDEEHPSTLHCRTPPYEC
jgi:hypothetical protein